MLHKATSVIARGPAASVRRLLPGALRLAPWLVFGPITGVLSESAIAAFRRRRPLLGGFYVLLNIGVLIALPTLTAAILAFDASLRA